MPTARAIGAIFLASASLVLGHDKAEGAFVQIEDGKLTLTTPKSDKKNRCALSKDVTVTVDGKAARQSDLKEGFAVVAGLDEEHVVMKTIFCDRSGGNAANRDSESAKPPSCTLRGLSGSPILTIVRSRPHF